MKTVWRKSLSLLLCLVMLAGLFPAALAEGESFTLDFVTEGEYQYSPITAEAGSTIPLPLPRWRSHVFLGWALEDGGEAVYQGGDSLVLTEDLTLYALWRDSRDLGLKAYVDGTTETGAEIVVSLGESVELAVDASVNEGGLRYEWFCYNTDCDQLPTNEENLSSWTLRDVDKHYDVVCQVCDEECNVQDVYFHVSPENGLWARALGGDQYQHLTVQKGKDVTLTVEAGADRGGLHYEWWCEDLDPSLLPTDDQASSFTIPSVDRAYFVQCRVLDDYGNEQYVYFDVSTDLGLEAYVAGTMSTYRKYTVQKGESVTLAVDAKVNEGGLRYVWQCSDDLDPSLLPADESTPSFTLSNIDRHHAISCAVYDDDNNFKLVHFDVFIDKGLKAYVANTRQEYASYKVEFGTDVTLAVDAEVSEGGLQYYWFAVGDSPADLPTDTQTYSFTLTDVQQRYFIVCEVRDDDGNSAFVNFEVYPDTGLEAWIVGNASNYRFYTVPFGESVTLAVEGKTNGGELHYNWYCETGDASVLPTDDKTTSFTIEKVEQFYSITCVVSDDYGVSVSLFMDISVDNALRAAVAGTQSAQIYFFENTQPQTLAVEASARGGELSYQWMRSEKESIYDYLLVQDASGPSLEVDAISRVCNYRCRVTDIYGSSTDVDFCFRPGMAQEIFLGQVTELRSDVDLGEICVSFTPEVTGQYSFRIQEEDVNAWISSPEGGVFYSFPASFSLQGGTTYYFLIGGQYYDFTVHLTVQNSGFRSFEELKALLPLSHEGDTLVYTGEDESFPIPEDLIIPAGRSIRLQKADVTVADGARLTLEEDSVLYCKNLTVLGAVENGGILDCYSLSGRDKVSQGEGGVVVFTKVVRETEDLYAVLEQAAADREPQYFYDINVTEDLALDQDLFIPGNAALYINRSVTLAPGATLELVGEGYTQVQIYGAGHLRIQGTLRNNSEMLLFGTETLILEEGGVYEGDGLIRAYSSYGSAEAYFPWLSLPEYSAYMVVTEAYEYVLKKRPPLVAGDVTWDGAVNARDLLCLRKELLGLKPDQAVLAPDVNGDGAVNILDLVRLRKILAANAQAQS